MAKLTLADAENIAARNRPWTIRLEFHGTNANNQSGVSSKYWYATGRGLTEQVETGWGAIGSAPQHALVDWSDLRKKVAEKLAKGYDWAATPYVRMSAANLAKITGQAPVQAPAAPAPVTPAPKPQSVKSTPTAGVMAATATSNALQALGVPYNLICSLKITRTGTKVTGYQGLDANGDSVMDFGPTNGLDFAKKYNLDIKFA